MKIKKKAALAAVLFSTAMNLSTCYDPNDNINDNVYGPPPETWEQEETDTEIVSSDDNLQSEEETDPDASEEPEGDEQQ